MAKLPNLHRKYPFMTQIEIRKIKTDREWKNLLRLYKSSFLRAERKPFLVLLSTWRKGKTDVWYAEEILALSKKRFIGFATTLNSENAILLDYLAVRKDARGQGAGSIILKTLLNAYGDKGFFVEIESIYDRKSKNLPERLKRRSFYTKNGLHALHVVADVFGIQMELLGRNMEIDFKTYNDFYRYNYSAFAAKNVKRIDPPDRYL